MKIEFENGSTVNIVDNSGDLVQSYRSWDDTSFIQIVNYPNTPDSDVEAEMVNETVSPIIQEKTKKQGIMDLDLDLETTNKLYLELSQVTTAKTNKELALERRLKELEDFVVSACAIGERRGLHTDWPSFEKRARKLLENNGQPRK